MLVSSVRLDKGPYNVDLAARDYQFNSTVVNFRDTYAPPETEVSLAGELFSGTIAARFIGAMMSSVANTSGSFALRPARSDDEAFLLELYCSTRREELSAVGLEGPPQEMFLKMQFAARQRHYEIAFPGAEHQIILLDNQPAGRILVYRSDLEIRLVDVALLPEHRGRGAGAWLIENLLAESRATARPVTLHVDKVSRAAHLYHRLGFLVTADTGADYKMEWREKETAKET